jgi:hypothetical protein
VSWLFQALTNAFELLLFFETGQVPISDQRFLVFEAIRKHVVSLNHAAMESLHFQLEPQEMAYRVVTDHFDQAVRGLQFPEKAEEYLLRVFFNTQVLTAVSHFGPCKLEGA